MDGYESPQKLFMNLDKTQNIDNKKNHNLHIRSKNPRILIKCDHRI